ncbi:MAG: hypothetical protein FJ291_25250 [Planctomycetes bacterium]|nr:hypothetical protein [Planctomycetota bacterium]
MFAKRRSVRGQATTEYILIVVLVAVLSIGIITVFGNQVRDLYRVATEAIGGGSPRLNSDITDHAQSEVRQSLGGLKDRSGSGN